MVNYSTVRVHIYYNLMQQNRVLVPILKYYFKVSLFIIKYVYITVSTYIIKTRCARKDKL